MHDGVQGVFRSINDRIAELRPSLAVDYHHLICECRDPRCKATLRVTPGEYRDITSVPGFFFVLPGHEDSAHERVVVGTGRYFAVTANPPAVVEAASPVEAPALADAA